MEGANGVKTGYTKAAGRILVSGAKRQGRQLLCVTIDAPDDWNDHVQLLEQGFSRYKLAELVQKGQILGNVEVLGGADAETALEAAEPFFYPIAEGETVTVELPGAGFAYAPVVEGESAGAAHILIDGKPVGKVNLVYQRTVEKTQETEKSLWRRLIGR